MIYHQEPNSLVDRQQPINLKEEEPKPVASVATGLRLQVLFICF